MSPGKVVGPSYISQLASGKVGRGPRPSDSKSHHPSITPKLRQGGVKVWPGDCHRTLLTTASQDFVSFREINPFTIVFFFLPSYLLELKIYWLVQIIIQ